MKNLSWVDKLLFLLNSIAAAALLLSNLLPYLSPKTFGVIAVFSLVVPLLIVLNILFSIYWVIKLKKQFLVSTIVLLIGFQQVNAFFKFTEKKVFLNEDLKIMSYNVRKFNLDHTIQQEGIDSKIYDFINQTNPDIAILQEFINSKEITLDFKFKFMNPYVKGKARNVIYSNFEIINSGVIDFKNSSNVAIFSDIVIKKDTVRVYNIHLQSLRIQLNKENFGEQDSEHLFKRIQYTFQKQMNQVEKILSHEKSCPYKTIIGGDFNNTAFSWAYHKIKADKIDAFIEAGNNFGKSYDYFFPTRIDFILVDPAFEINNFKTYDIKYSDHFPIMARLGIN